MFWQSAFSSMQHIWVQRLCTVCGGSIMEEKKIRPQDKWNEKAGYISKSYKLKKPVVEAFAAACEKAGVSQAGQLAKMMQAFIEEQKQQ